MWETPPRIDAPTGLLADEPHLPQLISVRRVRQSPSPPGQQVSVSKMAEYLASRPSKYAAAAAALAAARKAVTLTPGQLHRRFPFPMTYQDLDGRH
jgi:hypothetical protein